MTRPRGESRSPVRYLREEVCILVTSFVYFSRLPLAGRVAFSPQRLAASGRYFPVVGVVIGALGALAFGFALRYLPMGVAVLLSMLTTLLASGALHEDGLADCCDGFGGAFTRDDTLRIMKDSRIGAFGAIGLIVTLAMKWQTLTAIATLSPIAAIWTMIAGHTASRAAAIGFTRTLQYARSTGKAQGFERPPWWSIAVALLLGLPWLFWAGMALGVLQLLLLFVLHVLLGRWFQRRLGGYTGDCLGFAQQCFELTIYLSTLAWISS